MKGNCDTTQEVLRWIGPWTFDCHCTTLGDEKLHSRRAALGAVKDHREKPYSREARTKQMSTKEKKLMSYTPAGGCPPD